MLRITGQVEPRLTEVERQVLALLQESWSEVIVRPKMRVILHGKRRRLTPDFYIPSERLVVEAFGCFVHRCEECYGGHGPADLKKRYLDSVRIEALQRAGYLVEVVWEHDVRLSSPQRENTADPIPLMEAATA